MCAAVFGVALVQSGCADRLRADYGIESSPGSHSPYVASLGNLTTGPPPSRLDAEVYQFLFGVAPDAPLGLIKPTGLAARRDELLVGDGALQAVLRWTPDSAFLRDAPQPDQPRGFDPLAIAPNGDCLIGADAIVIRVAPDGRLVQRYALSEAGPRRVGGIAVVGDAIWVTNTSAHRIEVFDAASGVRRRSIGQRGRGPGEFGLPLGLATTPTGDVLVVDMLNARIQVLNAAGQWQRDIGGPGDRVGFFGRPRSVAVGPDGTIFVTDAASQRVHAFAPDGRALLAFGGQEEGRDALVLPGGIAIWSGAIQTARSVPAGFEARYFVLVAEQLVRPGIRVYAWHGLPGQSDAPRTSQAELASARNPHWQSTRCGDCHQVRDGRTVAINPTSVNQLCVSCHDGEKASAEPHPVNVLAATERTRVPADWPLVNGRVGCLTCHDILRQCATDAQRPIVNAALVRGFEPQDRFQSCRVCHIGDSWRVNPHRADPGVANKTANCGFCHVSSVTQPAASVGHQPGSTLREPATRLCLNCHSMHADPAPGTHLLLELPESMRLLVKGSPVPMPLDAGRITCATCHNPHPASPDLAGLFPGPAWQQRSTAPADAGKSLRMEHTELCRYCHPK